VIHDALSGIDSTLSAFINRTALEEHLYRVKRSKLAYPTGSTHPDALEIPDNYMCYSNGDPFVISDGFVGEERVVIMGSRFMLEVENSSHSALIHSL